MTKRLFVLIGGSALLWGALFVPAWLCWGDAQLLPSLAALGLVLVPAAATLVWVSGTYRQAPTCGSWPPWAPRACG